MNIKATLVMDKNNTIIFESILTDKIYIKTIYGKIKNGMKKIIKSDYWRKLKHIQTDDNFSYQGKIYKLILVEVKHNKGKK